ncbi:hypothetical protein JCM10213_008693 [Rhodosporidiobolus nylandii]
MSAASGGAYGAAGEVGTFTVLKGQPESKKAEMLLMKIHSLVKPIMKKHGWYLPVLSEFFPKQTNLLGVNINAGAKICIRLRPHDDPYSFLPLEDSLIGTMLHELTHNRRGPHDDLFFKILDGLQDEYDALRKSGYSGEGFLGRGRRVGEGVSHDPGSLREARERSLRTLEEKMRMQRLMGQGGRLGGSAPDTKGKRRGDILADAAERRLGALRICGGNDAPNHPSGSKKEDLPPEVQAEIDRAEKDSRKVVIDLTLLDSDEEDVPIAGPSSGRRVKQEKDDELPAAKRQRASSASSDDEVVVLPPTRFTTSAAPRPASATAASSSAIAAISRSTASRPPRPSARSAAPAAPPSSATTSTAASRSASTSSSKPLTRTATPQPSWLCAACTYGNLSPLSLACEVCGTERPAGTVVLGTELLPSGSGSGRREGKKEETDKWTCEACSTRNEHLFWTCGTCGRVKKSSERG